MATAKSDEDGEQRPHPLSQERPGVYVHHVGSSRRRGAGRAESGEITIEAASAEPITVPGETVEIEQIRESGVHLEGDATQGREGSSENTNHRADLMIVNLPAPPRVPSVGLSGSPLPEQRSASLLDAPQSLRPDTYAPRRGPSWLLLGCVAALSAIIAAAVVVALRQPVEPQETRVVAPEPAVEASPAAPSGFARYAAEDEARQRAAQLAAEEARAEAERAGSIARPEAKLGTEPSSTVAATPQRKPRKAAAQAPEAQPQHATDVAKANRPAESSSQQAAPAQQAEPAQQVAPAPSAVPATGVDDGSGSLPPNPYAQ